MGGWELIDLDKEVYRHLDPAVQGLTFSRAHLMLIFPEAERLWRQKRCPSTPSEPSSSEDSEIEVGRTYAKEDLDDIMDLEEAMGCSPISSSFKEVNCAAE